MARKRRVLCMPMTLDEDDGTRVSMGCRATYPAVNVSEKREKSGCGAREMIRTSTSFRTLEPESSASANSATRATGSCLWMIHGLRKH